MGKHPPSQDFMNRGRLAMSAVLFTLEDDVRLTNLPPVQPFNMPYWQHYRIRIKAMIQTRMIMVRYSVIAAELEDRAAWGDR